MLTIGSLPSDADGLLHGSDRPPLPGGAPHRQQRRPVRSLTAGSHPCLLLVEPWPLVLSARLFSFACRFSPLWSPSPAPSLPPTFSRTSPLSLLIVSFPSFLCYAPHFRHSFVFPATRCLSSSSLPPLSKHRTLSGLKRVACRLACPASLLSHSLPWKTLNLAQSLWHACPIHSAFSPFHHPGRATPASLLPIARLVRSQPPPPPTQNGRCR
jgi:hypothetical protein